MVVVAALTFLGGASTLRAWLVSWHVELPLVAHVVATACAVDFA